MGFRLSPKVTLEEGDQVRISGGPYFLKKDGSKMNMGVKGVGTFLNASEKGDGIYVRFGSVIKFVYIGEEVAATETGTIRRPHKVTKIRKKS